VNLDETVRFVALCRAAMPGWTPIDGTAEIWHTAAFADIRLGDAQTALLEQVRDEGGWPDPAKLRKRAVRIERERRGRERQAQLGGPPGFCGLPGCSCVAPDAQKAIEQQANTRSLGVALSDVFRVVP